MSLNWYNLYCEAFEMSCDLVTFPFFGAFAPCSDKQLKKKQQQQVHNTLRWAELAKESADRTEVETLTQFCGGIGVRDGERDTGRGTGATASPT